MDFDDRARERDRHRCIEGVPSSRPKILGPLRDAAVRELAEVENIGLDDESAVAFVEARRIVVGDDDVFVRLHDHDRFPKVPEAVPANDVSGRGASRTRGTTKQAEALIAAIRDFVQVVSKEVEPTEEDDWVDQKSSPLGRRAHLEAVRDGRLVGRKVGKRVLVRRSEVEAYIERHSVRTSRTSPVKDVVGDELRSLGFEVSDGEG